MEIKAVQKFIVTTPRKLRPVAALIKDLTPTEAFEKLPYVKKRAAGPLRKVVGTAIANAKQQGLKEEDLIFKEIQINEGPRLKRWRAGAKGRAKPYKKRMSHIRVILTAKSEVDKKTATPRSLKGLKTLRKKSGKSSTSRQKKGGKTRTKSVKSKQKSA